MKHPISFRKLNTDTSPHLTQQGDYFEAVNGRIIMNDSQNTFAFANEKGTSDFFSIGSITNNGSQFTVTDAVGSYTVPYTNSELTSLPSTGLDLKIIALTEIESRLIVITQEDSYFHFWDWNATTERLHLLYYNNFSAVNYADLRIQTRFENDKIQKLYFTDSSNFWHLNLGEVNNSSVINTPLNQLRVFPEGLLRSPELVRMLPGGSFEAGQVQYAYNLFSDSGAETKVSAFSDIFYTSNKYHGLNEAENDSQAFKIEINNIPEGFNLINIYRVFYSSDTATPQVKLIIEDQLQDTNYTFVDDNNLTASDSSLEALLFLGSDEFVPKDFAVKDNVMFPVNITYKDYDPDFDARAYAFNSVGDALIQTSTGGSQTLSSVNTTVAEDHDAINPSVKSDVGDIYYKTYRFQSNGTTLGVEGPNVKLGFVTNDRPAYDTFASSVSLNENTYANNFTIPNAFGNRSFKRDEVYRFFIRFTNNKGQKSFAKWIADVRMPDTTDFEISSESGTQIIVKDLGINVEISNPPLDAVGWEVLMEERTEADKTIKAQGFLNNTLRIPDDRGTGAFTVPNPFVRGYHNDGNITVAGGYTDGLGNSFKHDRCSFAANSFSNGRLTGSADMKAAEIKDTHATSYSIVDYVVDFYSPEVLDKRYQFDTSDSDYVNFIGGMELSNLVRFTGIKNANTKVGNTPSTSFEDLQVGQNANPLFDARSFIQWDGGEGMVIAPGATTGATPDSSYYINSYIAAFTKHDCNNILKVDISGVSKFIPKSSDRGSKEYSWRAVTTSSSLDNCSLIFKDQNGNTFDYGSFVNDRLSFNLDDDSSQTSTTGNRIGNILRNYGANNVNYITTQTTLPKAILVDYKTSVPNQYGGNTYEARKLNNPVVISDLRPIESTQRVIYGGDTYVCLWNFMRQQMYQGYYRRKTQRENVLIPIETSINLDLRHDDEFYTNLGKYQTTFDDYELPVDSYSRPRNYPFSSVKPLNFIENLNFGNRVLASNTKINGELKDSWLKYDANTYLDLEGAYGSITGIIEDRDQLFVFQPEAISQLLINPRVQSTDPIGIQLGKGDLLYDFQYLSTSSGSVNKFSLTKTPYGIVYYDALNNKISILNGSENPISDLKGMHSYLRKNINKNIISLDKPNNGAGVKCYYDHETKETYILFINDDINKINVNELLSGYIFSNYYLNKTLEDFFGEFTRHDKILVFSHVLDSFHFTHDFGVGNALNNRNNIYWLNTDLNKIYTNKTGEYGKYFDSYVDSKISFIANPSYANSTFDTIRFNADTSLNGSDVFNESIDKLRVYNEHQDTGTVNVSYGSDLVRKFREWRVNIPRELNTRNRIMSPYTFISMSWTNNNNKSKNLKDVIINHRVQTTDFT